jgi:hypothetical protein
MPSVLQPLFMTLAVDGRDLGTIQSAQKEEVMKMSKKGMTQLAVMGLIVIICCIAAAKYIERMQAPVSSDYIGKARIVGLASGERLDLLSKPDVATARRVGSVTAGAEIEIMDYAGAEAEQYAATARFDAVRFRGMGGAPGARTENHAYALVEKKDIESTAEAVVSIAVWNETDGSAKFYKGAVGPVDYLPHVVRKIDRWAKIKISAGGLEGWVPAFEVSK